MTQMELYTELKSTGLPVAYHHFTNPPSLPYIVYLFSGSDDLMADNRNYTDISYFDVELYSDSKDLANEKKLEDKFKDLRAPYIKFETYIESEQLYQVLYEIQII